MVKNELSGITPKILTFEYYAKNKTYSEGNFIYESTKFGQNALRNGRQKSKMAAMKFSFLTSDRGDFPRIIEIALFLYMTSLFCFQTC